MIFDDSTSCSSSICSIPLVISFAVTGCTLLYIMRKIYRSCYYRYFVIFTLPSRTRIETIIEPPENIYIIITQPDNNLNIGIRRT